MLKQLFKRLFPARTPHEWVESDNDDYPSRICTVCRRKDELDFGSGMCGPAWMTEIEGDNAKHLIPEKLV